MDFRNQMKIGIFKIRRENVEKTTIAFIRNRRCEQEQKKSVSGHIRGLLLKSIFFGLATSLWFAVVVYLLNKSERIWTS